MGFSASSFARRQASRGKGSSEDSACARNDFVARGLESLMVARDLSEAGG